MLIPLEVFKENDAFAGQFVVSVLLPQFEVAMDEDSDPALRGAVSYFFARDAMRWVWSRTSKWEEQGILKAVATILEEQPESHSDAYTVGSHFGACHRLFPRDQQHAFVTGSLVPALSVLGRALKPTLEGSRHLREHMRGCLIGLVLYLYSIHPESVRLGARAAEGCPSGKDDAATPVSEDQSPSNATEPWDVDLPF